MRALAPKRSNPDECDNDVWSLRIAQHLSAAFKDAMGTFVCVWLYACLCVRVCLSVCVFGFVLFPLTMVCSSKAGMVRTLSGLLSGKTEPSYCRLQGEFARVRT